MTHWHTSLPLRSDVRPASPFQADRLVAYVSFAVAFGFATAVTFGLI